MLEKFLENIHGTDAAIVAIVYFIGNNSDLSDTAVMSMAALGVVVMLGRIFFTVVRVRRVRRKPITRIR
ncbi:hypothetical protein KAR91_23605 [Candidatus Pacearchaeota archaeon]|nr:hypothetical protein [Candidatus Pacearchaeota archaeon]